MRSLPSSILLSQRALTNSLHVPPRHGPAKNSGSPQLCSPPMFKDRWLNVVAGKRGGSQVKPVFSLKSKAPQSRARVGMISDEVGVCIFQDFRTT